MQVLLHVCRVLSHGHTSLTHFVKSSLMYQKQIEQMLVDGHAYTEQAKAGQQTTEQ